MTSHNSFVLQVFNFDRCASLNQISSDWSFKVDCAGQVACTQRSQVKFSSSDCILWKRTEKIETHYKRPSTNHCCMKKYDSNKIQTTDHKRLWDPGEHFQRGKKHISLGSIKVYWKESEQATCWCDGYTFVSSPIVVDIPIYEGREV